MGGFIRGYWTYEMMHDTKRVFTSPARLVFLVLTHACDRKKQLRLSNDELLKYFGKTMSESTLQRALALLEAQKHIKREIITQPGHQNERIITILK